MVGHWSLAQALLAVAAIASGLGIMRVASPLLADAPLHLTYGILVVASVGAAVRRRHYGAWRGFAIVGWAYFLPVFVLGRPDQSTAIPTNSTLVAYVSRVRPRPAPPAGFGIVEEDDAMISYSRSRGAGPFPVSFRVLLNQYNEASRASLRAGHLLITLFLAYLGSILGDRMSRRRPGGRSGCVRARGRDRVADGM
jgi:hypothetical protein